MEKKIFVVVGVVGALGSLAVWALTGGYIPTKITIRPYREVVDTRLQTAIYNDVPLDEIKKLIQSNIALREQVRSPSIPTVWWAVGRSDVIKELVAMGADPSTRVDLGVSSPSNAVSLAVARNDAESLLAMAAGLELQGMSRVDAVRVLVNAARTAEVPEHDVERVVEITGN